MLNISLILIRAGLLSWGETLGCLNSLRTTSRLADISYNTVWKLFVHAAKACAEYQDRVLRNLPCFVYAKGKNVETAKAAPEGAGDVWTWVARLWDVDDIVSVF